MLIFHICDVLEGDPLDLDGGLKLVLSRNAYIHSRRKAPDVLTRGATLGSFRKVCQEQLAHDLVRSWPAAASRIDLCLLRWEWWESLDPDDVLAPLDMLEVSGVDDAIAAIEVVSEAWVGAPADHGGGVDLGVAPMGGAVGDAFALDFGSVLGLRGTSGRGCGQFRAGPDDDAPGGDVMDWFAAAVRDDEGADHDFGELRAALDLGPDSLLDDGAGFETDPDYHSGCESGDAKEKEVGGDVGDDGGSVGGDEGCAGDPLPATAHLRLTEELPRIAIGDLPDVPPGCRTNMYGLWYQPEAGAEVLLGKVYAVNGDYLQGMSATSTMWHVNQASAAEV